MSSSVASKKSSSSSRKSALTSRWMRRLCPPGHAYTHPSHVTTTIPFHPKSCFPLHALPKIPLLPPPPPPPPRCQDVELEAVELSEIIKGFGPFRVGPSKNPPPPPPPPAEGICSLFQHRRRLITGILGNKIQQADDEQSESRFASKLGPAHELVGESPSQLPPVDSQVAATSSSVATRQGYASRGKDRDDNHPVATARRKFYNPHAFGLNAARDLNEQQSYCLSSEPDEPFSYWNMGRLERRNFVSSVYPATSLPITVSRKRTAITYGFFPSKFGRVCSEDQLEQP